MRKVLVMLLPFGFAACADSIEKAGIGELKIDCQVITKVQAAVPVTCIEYKSGREIGSAKGELYLIEDGKQVKVLSFEVRGIKAFEGQAAAAEAIKDMTKDVTDGVAKILPDLVGVAIKGVKGPLP